MVKFDNNSNNNNKFNINADGILNKCRCSLKNGDTVSILFAGVGGQGIILAGTVLAQAAINEGFDVKVSEVHGMSQRGGSVEGSVRIGSKVFSPTINKSDFIIALEKLEGLRYIRKLGSGGLIIINNYEIYPSSVFLKGISYPDDIEERVSKITRNYIFVNAVKAAANLGEIRSSNIIMLGLLSNFLPFKTDCWLEAIKKSVPAKALNINVEAFGTGKNMFCKKK
ncbi:MAG: indolepyruvate oxidoreductase subunit beta [Actinobacteria bacterium]|nr:indolepyruvate oxidoreductase subunit beta [Actinomycetota bacterium]